MFKVHEMKKLYRYLSSSSNYIIFRGTLQLGTTCYEARTFYEIAEEAVNLAVPK